MNKYKYKVVESGTITLESIVEVYADSQQEADELCKDGDYSEILDSSYGDFEAEEIVSIKRMKR